VGFEALLRWLHPQKGLLPAAQFISVAEETGLIIRIGEWVLEQACHQATLFQRLAGHDLRMVVNVSARQFRQRDFVDVIRRTLAATKLVPRCLELEITESVIMDDS